MKKERKIILVIAFLCFSFIGFSQKETKNTKQNKVLEGVHAVSIKDYPYIHNFHHAIREKISGNYTEAKELFKNCLEVRTDDDAVYFGLAEIAKMEDNTIDALNYYQKAYHIDPNNLTYLRELAYMNYRRGNFKKAEVLFKKMCEIEPRNINFRYGYCNVLIYTKSYQKAIREIDTLQALTGTIPKLMIRKADMYTELKEEEKAEATLLQLKEEFPNNLKVLKKIIGYYEHRENKEKAMQLIEELLHKDPENGRAKYILANNYLSEKQKDKFLAIAPDVIQSEKVSIPHKLFVYKHFQSFKSKRDTVVLKMAAILYQQYPENKETALNYANVLVAQQHRNKALKVLQSSAQKNQHFETWALLLNFEAVFDKNDSLYKDGKIALRLFPNQPVIYYLTAKGALYSGYPEEALDLLNAGKIFIIEDKKSEAWFAMRRGEIYFYKKKYKKGIVSFEKALSIQKDPTIKITYALALTKANIAPKVSKELLDKIAEEEKTQDYYFALANYYANTKEYEKGIKMLKEKIKTIVYKRELYDKLGDLYFQDDAVSKAVKAWEKARLLHSRNKVLTKKIKEEKYYAPQYN